MPSRFLCHLKSRMLIPESGTSGNRIHETMLWLWNPQEIMAHCQGPFSSKNDQTSFVIYDSFPLEFYKARSWFWNDSPYCPCKCKASYFPLSNTSSATISHSQTLSHSNNPCATFLEAPKTVSSMFYVLWFLELWNLKWFCHSCFRHCYPRGSIR